jgi:hypothetical protein
MRASQTTESAVPQAPEAREAELLQAEIRRDMKVLADYVAEHGDPAELREMFEARDAT